MKYSLAAFSFLRTLLVSLAFAISIVGCGGGSSSAGKPGDVPVVNDPGANQALGDQISSCGRTVYNLFSRRSENLSYRKVIPDPNDILYSPDFRSATFDLVNTNGRRLFIGNNLALEKNKKYAFRIKVSNFSGPFGEDNLLIVGGNDADFIGERRVSFVGDGVYGLVITYVGENNTYSLRIGIGVRRDDNLAADDGTAHFTIEELMWEELDSDDDSPSEFVAPGNVWAFNYEKANSYDIRAGLVSDATGLLCVEPYRRAWAITADSFGNDTVDFAYRLLDVYDYSTAFYIDAVPGRTLSNALQVFSDLIDLSAYPNNVAKPYGVIIQGGINDIVKNATLSDMQTTIIQLLESATMRSLKVVVLTVSPFKNNKKWNASREAVRVAYNDWLTSEISLMPDIYVYDIAAPVSEGGLSEDADVEVLARLYDGPSPDKYDGDGLHPNFVGGRVIAQGLMGIMDSISNL